MSEIIAITILLAFVALAVFIVIGLFIKFWYVFLVVGIYYTYRWWQKRQEREMPTIKPKPDPVQVIKKEKPQPSRTIDQDAKIDPRILSYVDQKPEIIIKDGKRINKRTGHALATKSSIATSKNNFDNAFSNSLGAESFKVNDYYIRIYLPYYFAGVLAYKRGDWDTAEAIWLSVLCLQPDAVSDRVAIMYRKQHRYQDVADMYVKAINDANTALHKINNTLYQQMVVDLIDAGNKALQHKSNDKSCGIKAYECPVDIKHVAQQAK